LDVLLAFVILAPLGFLVQSLFSISPQTGFEVWLATLVNFSLPMWLYFILSDRSARGATLGKRLLRLRVTRHNASTRVSTGQAVLRTAIKLLPWELVHVAGFAAAGDFSTFSTGQALGLALANLLTIVYLAGALASAGRRSIHDFAANTEVRFDSSTPASELPPV
jgi:uncharacterized RDD family membrane protein YckC